MSKYWLMKTEPEVFSIDDLAKLKKAPWEGVRNYQARNFMRDEMQLGDKILIYHSNANPPGVAGIAEVSALNLADNFALDPQSKYYDPKATKEKNPWVMVEVKFIEKFPELISLHQLKNFTELSRMQLLQKGNRLSVMPLERKEFDYIVKLGEDA